MPGLIAFLVLGSIYGGVASVTEAAAMGVFGVFLAVISRGEFSFKMLHASLNQALMTCGMIIWIGLGASALVGVYNLMGSIDFVESVILSLSNGHAMVTVLIMMVCRL